MAEWDDWETEQTPDTFRAIFPEYARASDAMVSSRIAMALTRTPEDVWGDLQAQGVAWLTAHLLALLPEAKDMRQGERKGESMYLDQRKTLETVVGGGFRVALNATALAGIPLETVE